ncbi:MAG TPA: carboxypeptidase-like regulatory domain-containing protein, partial [Pyrinomonadaceae bacterium]|nr:carboxypeptidase-like regulatory domain-containing protein [Pyrinomonadaceae bacterium]
SVEGYAGLNLTATHGIDPQTVLGTEFASHQLPNTPTNVAANKSNPSAFNAGGVAEFDSGTFLAIGIQGNTNSNPYLVFYLNTTGRTNVTMSYTVQDIDGGSNNAVSQLALQYRVGQTGLFTNVPAGYIADVTVGGATGPAQNMNVVLPAAVNNQPQVQVRLITTNAANTSGGSTSDEWIGINNVSFSSSFAPTAAGVTVGGRVVAANGMGIRGALVTLWDSTGNSRTATTSSFGYYRFADVEVGQTYIFSVSSKRYTFANPTIVRSVSDSIADIDFVEEGAPPILNVAPSREVKVTSPRKAVRD